MFKCFSIRSTQHSLRPYHSLRKASTSSNPFPFPTNVNPTPLQIFHLPPSASRDEVKARCPSFTIRQISSTFRTDWILSPLCSDYDLVRIYHPDSPISRSAPPDTAHARFQAISAAYATLSGKAQGASTVDSSSSTEGVRPDYHSLSTAMWRARQRKRAELDVGMDDRWKDRMMLGAIILSLVVFVWQTYSVRLEAMSEGTGRYRHYPSTSRKLPAAKSDAEILAASEKQDWNRRE
ncbi:hypothetical protein AcW1_009192 [Taiwanofungus camphoratus]|nr:hypothetical protein AcV5_007215 [Antrodia cinnamomea]KAI0949645.1 hypothetical protein AcW1_009192 [Antrodia cinnamomea]